MRTVSPLALAALMVLVWTLPAQGSDEAPPFHGSVEHIDPATRQWGGN